MMLSTSLMKLSPDLRRVDPMFIYYYFRSEMGRRELLMRASTVGTPGIGQPLSSLRSIPIPVPPINEQRGIAATLGALDDKIESNRRAIRCIQELSRLIYQQWRTNCPDTEGTTFGQFADVFGGATPKTAEPSYWNGGIAWATPTDITAMTAPYLYRTARTISQEGLDSTSATLHPLGTIFMTSRATIGAFAVTQLPAATNQGFIAVRPRKPEHRWFLFEEMRARVPEMLDRANGSTFMELSRGNFKLMTLAVPNEDALCVLDADLAPLHNRAAQLDRESSHLALVRESLLPELLSGRIRVPQDAEAVAEVVA
jgi:type I restriction enzyme S subunit